MNVQSSVPVTPQEELELIRTAQRREIPWWKHHATMNSLEHIEIQVILEQAVRLPGDASHYEMAQHIRNEFRVLNIRALAALDYIAITWIQTMQRQGIPCDDLFLVLTSLGRTTEHQRDIIDDGHPGAFSSTHCKLGAFDIGVRWFKDNDRRDALVALDTVLAQLHLDGRINWIYEQSIGVYHVAANPTRW